MRIVKDSLDDLLQAVFSRILRVTSRYQGTHGGPFREQLGAHLILKKPLARLSITESRSTLVSCLAETLWYLSGSCNLDMIEFWVPGYKEHLDDPQAATTPGAYGPRLFGPTFQASQFLRVIQQIESKPSSRTAIVQVFRSEDIGARDSPCTCLLQFFVRGHRLHLIVYMRSNDAFMGLPHDIFAFTWLQELAAVSLSLPIGEYHHMVGSLHLYDTNEKAAREYLNEGWQELNTSSMPSMPNEDPWQGIEWLLDIEGALRSGATVNVDQVKIDPYWRDLARVLSIQAKLKTKPLDMSIKRQIVEIGQKMHSPYYESFVRRKSAIRHKSEGPLFDPKSR